MQFAGPMQTRGRNPLGAVHGQTIRVAACIVRDGQGRVLMAKRRPDQLSGGYWEIPGGKIEPGETAAEAASRELFEETGLTGAGLRPLSRYRHRFPTRRIDLHLFAAQSWSGTPVGRESQLLEWVSPGAPQVGPVLASNVKALRLLSLPRRVLGATAPKGDPAAWAGEYRRRAVSMSAGAVLLSGPRLPAAQQMSLARRLGAELCHTGVSLWLGGVPGGAPRAGAALEVRAAGATVASAAPVGSDVAHAVIDPDAERLAACGLDRADVLIVPVADAGAAQDADWSAFRRLASETARPVYAMVSAQSGAAEAAIQAGAYGICVCDG